jgi:hypothetical protein
VVKENKAKYNGKWGFYQGFREPKGSTGKIRTDRTTTCPRRAWSKQKQFRTTLVRRCTWIFHCCTSVLNFCCPGQPRRRLVRALGRINSRQRKRLTSARLEQQTLVMQWARANATWTRGAVGGDRESAGERRLLGRAAPHHGR